MENPQPGADFPAEPGPEATRGHPAAAESEQTIHQEHHGVVHQTHDQDSQEVDLSQHSEWLTPWTVPSNLEAPIPRPGMVQRWCRYEILGSQDPANASKRAREGWFPRPADTVPEGYSAPTIAHGEHAGLIVMRGLVLCEMPATRWEQREDYYRGRKLAQRQSIERDLQQAQDPNQTGLGPIQNLSRSRHVTGRRPIVND